MKNTKLLALILFSMLLTTSCVDDDVQEIEGEFATTPFVIGFSETSRDAIFQVDGSVQTLEIPVNLINGLEYASSPNITASLIVDATSTAVPGTDFNFTNPSQTVTIEEDRDFGMIELTVDTDNIDVDNSKTLVLRLAEPSVGLVAQQFQTISIEIIGLCVSDLAGMYSVTTTYGYHDFLPAYNPNTMDIEVVSVGDGLYEVFDFSGGLYSSGPYADAYNTGPTSFTVQFSDICNNITWSGQTDPWGACTPLDGGVNAVNPTTGVITISWFCEGYGENGVSVYTPID
ncbi:hypothetical protein [Winogradskyella ouciana]|uniref:Calx-beta domain-containing protein n=1 Tax=Winogradskyella ouciana TaxID=2608631 RepID=A0A7K1GFA9_9FLAO|nr:hypothetical protein [Winogradskyella ouciana]MTE27966.1 hypothetical protein [Winogradskyella ouciana]